MLAPIVRRTPAAARVTDLILEVFRLNGRLLAAGDRLVGDLGLSSARWQVLGAINVGPLTVAQIGRAMGLTRQAVQRVVNELEADGIVELVDNPEHRRARLVRLTPEGRNRLDEATRRQAGWVNRLSRGVHPDTAQRALELVSLLRQRLEHDEDTKGRP